jgi:hypothetical protein
MENEVVESVRRQSMDNGRVAALPCRARAMAPLAAAALLATAVAVVAVPVRAATYKWVDENGVVHYTDKMPPEAVNKGVVQLNKQGVPIKKTEAALTPEQRRAQEAAEAQRREAAKVEAERERRDRALLSSYTTEAEIDLARQRALSTIDSVVHSARAYGEQLTRRKHEAEIRKASYDTGKVPLALERELEGIDRELARQNELLELKKRETDAVIAKYDAEKRRWRELIAAKGSAAPQSSQGITPTSANPAVVAPGTATAKQ